MFRLFTRSLLQALVWGLALTFSAGHAVAQSAAPVRTAVTAGADDPDMQLQAIKAALLAAVDQAPTRVLSTAWVDAQGSLRENTVYHTDTRIQGVRVLSYLQGETETREQKITRMAAHVVLPPHLRKPAKGQQTCPAASSVRWRMPLAIDHAVHPGTGALGHAVGLWLSRQIDQLSAELSARSARWYAVPSAASASPLLQGAYWQTYLGRPKEDPDWRLRIRILPAAEPADADASASLVAVPEWVRAWMPPPAAQRWVVDMVLLQEGQAPVWQWQTLLDNVHPESDHAAAKVVQVLRERLPLALAQLDRETECVAVQYALRPLAQHQGVVWSVAAGQGAQLRAGDRVLVFDRQSLPSRIYEAESLRRVALAEVTRAGLRQTELRQLAGPPLPLNGDWVAMPL